MVSDVLETGFLPDGDRGFRRSGRYYVVQETDPESRTARATRWRVEQGRLVEEEAFVEGPVTLVGADVVVIDGLHDEVTPSRDRDWLLRRVDGDRYHIVRGFGLAPEDGEPAVAGLRQTEYFKRRVLEGRPYIRLEWCETAVRDPEASEVQSDGRVRYWRFVPELGKHLRVVTLSDRRTLHNAFPDRSFCPPEP